MSDKIEIISALSEIGQEKFGKVTKKDRKLFGKKYAKDSLLAFARYIDPKFEDPWHIAEIIRHLMLVESKKIPRLIVNMPPQHGKSQIITRIFPAWWLGRHPDNNVIIMSYSDSKASRFTRWVRDCVESNPYHDIFPDTVVRRDVRAAEEWKTTKGGGMLGAGMQGGATGDPANLLIIDDPYKNLEQARSEAIGEKIWENYTGVAEARLADAIIIVHTRWTKTDLTGRLLGEDEEEDAA